jgi:hypothetical protein
MKYGLTLLIAVAERQDVRMPDILDIGRRYQAIGNRYREIFAGSR